MFRADFDPAAIAEAAATLPTPGPYLVRLRADVKAELVNANVASRSTDPFVRQFARPRAVECYAALAAIDEAEGRPPLATLG